MPDGEEIKLTDVKPNDFFGELAIAAGKLRTATAMSITQTETVCVEKEYFLGLLNELSTIKYII